MQTKARGSGKAARLLQRLACHREASTKTTNRV